MTDYPLKHFPYTQGDTIYLRLPEFHYVGTITKICPEGNWVELYPVVHVIENSKAQSFYQNGLVSSLDRFEVSPVPVQTHMNGWSATIYPFTVPTVNYKWPL